MNLENLRGFLAVAETLNFRAAAERLFISQPALSRQIAELEKAMGVTLLNRTTRTVSLTPAGRESLPFASGIVARWDDMCRSARLAAAGAGASLKLGIYGNRTTHYIAPAIEQLKSECPQVQLSMVSDSADNLRRGVSSGGLDLVCMMAPVLSGIPNLNQLVLSEEFPSVMLPQNHPLADRELISPTELADERFIMHSRKKSIYMYNALIKVFTDVGVTPNVIGTEDNDALLVMRVVMGEAVGLYPSDWRIAVPTVHREIPAGTVLVHLDCDHRPFARVAAWKKDCKNPVVELFVSMIRNSLGLRLRN